MAAHFDKLSANGVPGRMLSSCAFVASPQTSVRSEPVEDRCDVTAHFDKLSANGVWGKLSANGGDRS
jgi:hypothetical protein